MAMDVLMIGLAVLAVLVGALHFLEIQRCAQRRERQFNGLQAVQHGIALMTVIQQHRGISAAVLNGNRSFVDKQTAKQSEISAALVTLAGQLARDRTLASSHADLKALTAEWESLREKVVGMDPTMSYIVHTDLVRHVLHFIGDIGERAGLLEHRDSTLTGLLDTLLLRLPLLVETAGQVRAMGTGFAAKGRCNAVGRIRLNFLGQRIQECLGNLDPALGEISRDSRDKLESLLTLLNSSIIAAEKIAIDPERYFNVSTEAIDACLMLWRKAAGMAGARLMAAH